MPTRYPNWYRDKTSAKSASAIDLGSACTRTPQLAVAAMPPHNRNFPQSPPKEFDMAKAKSAVPAGFRTVTPQLTLDNAAQTIEWYKKALGAEEVSRATGPDGKIMHAEIRVGDSIIMLNDVMGA